MELLSSDLVFAHLKVNNATEALHFLAGQLKKQGKVKPDFEQAVLKREQVHPTGLPSGKIAVAIPHTDVQYVKEAAITFATLARPVAFHNMAVTAETVNVQIIVMLALKNPHSQVKILQKLMALFQDQELLQRLEKMTDQQKLYEAVSEYIK